MQNFLCNNNIVGTQTWPKWIPLYMWCPCAGAFDFPSESLQILSIQCFAVRNGDAGLQTWGFLLWCELLAGCRQVQPPCAGWAAWCAVHAPQAPGAMRRSTWQPAPPPENKHGPHRGVRAQVHVFLTPWPHGWHTNTHAHAERPNRYCHCIYLFVFDYGRTTPSN